MEGDGIGARLDKEIGRGFRQNADNIRCTVRNLPRFSRKAQWYVYDMGAGPLASKAFEGWIKWADQKELTTKRTHQVFYELKNPDTFDVSDDVARKYEIAQEGKDNRNPKKLADRQLVFFHMEAGRVADVGPVQMYKNVYRFGTLEKLKDLGRQVANDENAFTPCDDRQKACPACRLFGFIPKSRKNPNKVWPEGSFSPTPKPRAMSRRKSTSPCASWPDPSPSTILFT